VLHTVLFRQGGTYEFLDYSLCGADLSSAWVVVFWETVLKRTADRRIMSSSTSTSLVPSSAADNSPLSIVPDEGGGIHNEKSLVRVSRNDRSDQS
jgi:hypothetical protein